jgi:hypothetical protein
MPTATSSTGLFALFETVLCTTGLEQMHLIHAHDAQVQRRKEAAESRGSLPRGRTSPPPPPPRSGCQRLRRSVSPANPYPRRSYPWQPRTPPIRRSLRCRRGPAQTQPSTAQRFSSPRATPTAPSATCAPQRPGKSTLSQTLTRGSGPSRWHVTPIQQCFSPHPILPPPVASALIKTRAHAQR